MRRKFVVSLTIMVFCFLTFPSVQAFSQNREGRPKAEIPETEYVFPKVVDGTNVTHTFTVLNKGDAPLVISNVQTG